MGLGPSHHPDCPQCPHSDVTFIYKGPEIPELEPWWNLSTLYNNESRYWACQKCINQIPKKYRDKFIYNENYTVWGM